MFSGQICPMISDLTFKVVAYSDLMTVNGDDCVDWAIEMLQLEHETPSLLILAGLAKPTNQFEVREYLKRALSELKLDEKTGNDATLSYCSYYILKISRGEEVKRNLGLVYEFCRARDYEKNIFDFYLLYWAWNDLDHGDEYQHYWPDASRHNIKQIVIDIAEKWVVDNEKHYAQHKI
jgi:hypothetical protein